MTVCCGCGGTVGRECFNPQECVEITRQMAQQYQQTINDQSESLQASIASSHLDQLKASVTPFLNDNLWQWVMLPNGARGWQFTGYLSDGEFKDLFDAVGKESPVKSMNW